MNDVAKKLTTPDIPDEIHYLWDELADFGANRIDDAHAHLMKTLCGWLQADNALWVGGVHINGGALARNDLQRGWRGRAVRYLNITPEMQSKSRQAARTQDTDPGMTTVALTEAAGRFRVYRLHDGFIDIKTFKCTEHYRVFYRETGISDRLWVVFPVNADAESYFIFDRYRSRRRFSSKDAQLAASVLRGLKWLHRGVMLSHGLLIANKPLSPVQRRLLSFLLTEKSEREIAQIMELTPATVHTYITALYRVFGVKSRASLMALWLRA